MPASDTTSKDVVGSLLLQVDDVVETLAKRHPTADPKLIQDAGRIMALISRVVLRDAATVLLFRDMGDDAMVNVVHDMRASIDQLSVPRTALSGQGPAVTSRGSGLGEIVGLEEGRARLVTHADKMSLEAWAGPVASPRILAEREGISTASLRAWRRAGTVIELSRGHRRPVFPVRQFLRHRPVSQLAELQAVIGDSRTTWLWLIEPGRDGSSSWIDVLKEGRTEEVLEAAREDFA